MTYQDAAEALAALRYSGDLEQIRQLIDAYDREPASSHLWESACLLLQACDVLSSHEFGDRQGQAELIRIYAQRALLRSGLAGIEEELRLLVHLLHDYEDDSAREPWPVKRRARAQRWLRALKVLAQDTRDFDPEDLPPAKSAVPVQDLPSGVAAHHIENLEVRRKYQRAVNQSRHHAERFAFQWRMRQLRRVYLPLATKYITSAYAREPYNLAELKHLLDDYSLPEEEPTKEPTDVNPRVTRGQTVEAISVPEAPVVRSLLRSKTKPAKVKGGRKARGRNTKEGRT